VAVTAETWAEELIKTHGLPRDETLYRALLEYTFVRGKIEGGNHMAGVIQASFSKPPVKLGKSS